MPAARPTRRAVLVGGGVGIGLTVAVGLWPRRYLPNLTAAPGETVYSAWLKIGEDGRVVVAVPQAETGQGVWTALPQILADELGADWRTIGVEPAPLHPVYANPLGLRELCGNAFDRLPDGLVDTRAARDLVLLTGGATSVRMFEVPLREAGAAARVLLQQAAAARWNIDWRTCDVAGGFVTAGARRARFGELAAEAAGGSAPDPVPLRAGTRARLTGQAVPRLDAPAKVDGSINFAGDVRLPDMVFASIRHAPGADARLRAVDRAAADRVPGVLKVVTTDGWAAAIGTTWWGADRGLAALAPRFAGRRASPDPAAALAAALDADGVRMTVTGDPDALLRDGAIVASYTAAPSLPAALETPAATARWHDGRVELWLATQAPGSARAAVAAVLGIAPEAVTIHPLMVGGGFGAALDHRAAEAAALLARTLRRPVQLTWSRGEALTQERSRPAVAARLAARIGAAGRLTAWRAGIAAPATGRVLARRLTGGAGMLGAALRFAPAGDADAVAGALPPYRLPAVAIDHHPVDPGMVPGHIAGGAHGYTCFFTESFLDELAHGRGTDPAAWRIGMLGGQPRLARCLSTAAALGGWEGGRAGSGQGIAAHAFRGSHIAVLAEAHVDDRRIVVDRLVAAVDCGAVINPDLVRQSIERGLVFGTAAALGATYPATRLTDLALPTLATTPDITVELIDSDEAPGGASDLGIPPVAPAIANAIFSASRVRLRRLPLSMDAA